VLFLYTSIAFGVVLSTIIKTGKAIITADNNPDITPIINPFEQSLPNLFSIDISIRPLAIETNNTTTNKIII
jgi:hypothetical protein